MNSLEPVCTILTKLTSLCTKTLVNKNKHVYNFWENDPGNYFSLPNEFRNIKRKVYIYANGFLKQ